MRDRDREMGEIACRVIVRVPKYIHQTAPTPYTLPPTPYPLTQLKTLQKDLLMGESHILCRSNKAGPDMARNKSAALGELVLCEPLPRRLVTGCK